MTTLTASVSLPFELGEPSSFGGLSIVPLRPAREPELEYVGLDEAVARGLVVTEVGDGAVPTLLVSNPLDANVLLYAGEELVGAKQDRILDRPVLVQARSKATVPVTCVERGRWSARTSRFAAAPRAAYPSLRSARAGGGQAAAWANVSAKAERLDALSATEAAGELYDRSAATLERYLAKLPRRAGQCGAIAAVAGRVVCLDYVSRPDVYAGLHAKLVRGYALDALEQPVEAPVREAALRRLLATLARAQRTPAAPTGLGLAATLAASGLAGAELRLGEEVVALTATP